MRRMQFYVATIALAFLIPLAAMAAPINGAFYAVAPGAVDGSSGSLLSFIRLFNGSAAATTFTIRVVGAQTGQVYGQSATIQMPAGASVQYVMGQLLALTGSARGAGIANGDTSFAVYVQDPDAATGYQHVYYDGATQFMENATVCGNGLLSTATLASSGTIVVPNAHTSILSNFPSQISLYNYGTTDETVKIQLVDAGVLGVDGSTISAGAGTTIGQTNVLVPANTTVTRHISDLQTALNWTPTAAQFHVNVVVSDANGATPTLNVRHTVQVGGSSDPTNMTTACALNDPASATKFQGTIAGTNQQSATMTVNLQSLTATTSQSAFSGISHALATLGTQQASSGGTTATLLLSGGGTVTLSGNYIGSSGSVTLTGGGYSFTGSVSSGILSGSYTGPNGVAGSFSTLSAAQGTVTAYCGTYHSTRQPPGQPLTTATGVFNVQIAANGMATGDTTPISGDSSPGTFTGQQNGSVINVVHHSIPPDPANDTAVTANLQNGVVSGNFTTNGGTGTFSGTVCALP